MLQPQQKAPLNLMAIRLFWGGLLSSQAIYLLVLTFAAPKEAVGEADLFLKVIPSLATVFLMMGVFVPRILWKKMGQKINHATISNLPEVELVMTFFPAFIIRLALFEGIAVLGFALSFMSGRVDYYYAFVSLSAFCFLMNFPTKEKIITCLKQ
ncbi:MAG: hypothetical protein ACOYL6_10705 [Bacteriovoracaceae bacterium]